MILSKSFFAACCVSLDKFESKGEFYFFFFEVLFSCVESKAGLMGSTWLSSLYAQVPLPRVTRHRATNPRPSPGPRPSAISLSVTTRANFQAINYYLIPSVRPAFRASPPLRVPAAPGASLYAFLVYLIQALCVYVFLFVFFIYINYSGAACE